MLCCPLVSTWCSTLDERRQFREIVFNPRKFSSRIPHKWKIFFWNLTLSRYNCNWMIIITRSFVRISEKQDIYKSGILLRRPIAWLTTNKFRLDWSLLTLIIDTDWFSRISLRHIVIAGLNSWGCHSTLSHHKPANKFSGIHSFITWPLSNHRIHYWFYRPTWTGSKTIRKLKTQIPRQDWSKNQTNLCSHPFGQQLAANDVRSSILSDGDVLSAKRPDK